MTPCTRHLVASSMLLAVLGACSTAPAPLPPSESGFEPLGSSAIQPAHDASFEAAAREQLNGGNPIDRDEDARPAVRQNGDDVQQGSDFEQWELTLNGAGSNDQDFNAGTGQLSGSLGYYVTEELEVQVRQTLSFFDPGEGIEDQWNGITRVALDYHFPLECWWPFLGVNLGYIYGDTVNETMTAGAEGGVKVYVKEDTFIQGMVEYDFFFDESDRIEDAFEDGAFFYSLGVGFRF